MLVVKEDSRELGQSQLQKGEKDTRLVLSQQELRVPKTALFRALIFWRVENNVIRRRWLPATDTLYCCVHLNQTTQHRTEHYRAVTISEVAKQQFEGKKMHLTTFSFSTPINTSLSVCLHFFSRELLKALTRNLVLAYSISLPKVSNFVKTGPMKTRVFAHGSQALTC